jgi:protein-disulfide isomerase
VLKPRLTALLFASLVAVFGCHAQKPAVAPGTPLSVEQARRVEVLVRQKANLPPGSTVQVGPRTPSDVDGFDSVAVTIASDGNVSHPISFLLSKDGKTLAQFTKYDISGNPRDLISGEGRPARGGPADAPVLIVGFDDLECPFCARMHATIFPAIGTRYGDKVRIVYRDFPLEQHPWAMHAAVDVNCLAAQSPTGYWNLVDGIHAHANDISEAASNGDKDKALERVYHELDTLTLEQGKLQQVDLSKLNVCLQQQDTKAIDASVKFGTSLGLDSTPTLFINGDKVDGALPIEFVFQLIDDALRAENVTPPPPYVAPAPPKAPATASPASPAASPAPAAASPAPPAKPGK